MSIVNYLKNSKKVTAPRNWKSAPDSPETQLAYVTQPEIDMLVKANLHDSMDGKPNRGPNGIISLDGGGSSKKIKTKRHFFNMFLVRSDKIYFNNKFLILFYFFTEPSIRVFFCLAESN